MKTMLDNFLSRTTWFALAMIVGLLNSNVLAQDDSSDDWRRWRGPAGNGIAAAGQTPPTEWNEDNNVLWKAKVPGRGHASPIVVDDKIFLATADESTMIQSVLCYDRSTGKQLWKSDVSEGEFNPRIHPKNTHASPTISTDGERVFAVFNNHNRVQLVALDLAGEKVWEKEVGAYKTRFPFGFGSSPICHGGNVIVANLNDIGSGITAYNGGTGDQVWKIERPGGTSYSTPVVANIGGSEQLLLSGTQKVFSYDPSNGKERWTVPGKWQVTCGTMVWDDDLVFASGGYPAQQTLAIKADGSGSVVWENGQKAYEQSMIIVDGYVYAHCESGVVYCWRAADGAEMWKERFSSRRDAQSASPVSANGNIYFTSESGETLVIKANPKKMEVVARNKLGDESFASMAVCGNKVFTRVATMDFDGSSRQEWLFCIGKN